MGDEEKQRWETRNSMRRETALRLWQEGKELSPMPGLEERPWGYPDFIHRLGHVFLIEQAETKLMREQKEGEKEQDTGERGKRKTKTAKSRRKPRRQTSPLFPSFLFLFCSCSSLVFLFKPFIYLYSQFLEQVERQLYRQRDWVIEGLYKV